MLPTRGVPPSLRRNDGVSVCLAAPQCKRARPGMAAHCGGPEVGPGSGTPPSRAP